MKISYNWLKQYFSSEVTFNEILEALPLMGFDVEETEIIGPPDIKNVVVGKVSSFVAHPNADRLRLCKVATDVSGDLHSIICGAKNFKEGDHVMVALPGAILPGNFKIKVSKLRGIESQGMLCSAKELNISDDNDGILVLDDSNKLGTPLNDVFKKSDVIFHLEITPNRVDVLSHIGLARELYAKFGGSLSIPSKNNLLDDVCNHVPNSVLNKIDLKADTDCFEYNTLCIEGVKVGPSPDWMKEALESIGLRSINNIVDITNYILHESGQPMHAFDAGKLEGNSIIVRHAHEGESIITLDEKEHQLDRSIVVIADSKKPLAIAGVMGGLDAEVSSSTTSIIIEVACFNPSSIRMTSRKLGISTDSSYRFERGTDPKGLSYAINRALKLIHDIAGGKQVGKVSRLKSNSPLSKKYFDNGEIDFSLEKMHNFIGFSVSDADVKSVFEKLNFQLFPVTKSNWRIRVPSYRGDIKRPVDLYEEFIRVFGTNMIPKKEITISGINTKDHPIYTFNKSILSFLTSKGFNETYSNTLRDYEEFKLLYGESNSDAKFLKLNNPLQSDQTHLRNSLITGLIDVYKLNLSRQNSYSRFFELGRVFSAVNNTLCELISVAFISPIESRDRKWIKREPMDFYSAKSIVEDCIRLLPLEYSKFSYSLVHENHLWQSGHSAKLGCINEHNFESSVGLLNLKNLKSNWGITGPIIAGSILINPEVFKNNLNQVRYSEISKQPTISKDLALIVKKDIPAGDVKFYIKATIGSLLKNFLCESIEIFDVYQGNGLSEDEKSIALSMQFRALDRTLNDTEVNSLFDALQSKIIKDTEFKIRKMN